MATRMSSRQFNQDTSGAKRAAESGPVYITDRGRPAHVLLTYEAYEQLTRHTDAVELLGSPPGVEDVELPEPRSGEPARPASFE